MIGQKLQEPPEVLNYANRSKTPLINNITLAIEPMISLGTWEVVIGDDDWAVITHDHQPSAQFETTIIVSDNDPEILVPFTLQCAYR